MASTGHKDKDRVIRSLPGKQNHDLRRLLRRWALVIVFGVVGMFHAWPQDLDPQAAGSWAPPNSRVRSMAMADGLLYGIDTRAGLIILDISDPEKLVQIGRFDDNWSMRKVVVMGPYAYVTAGNGGLQILDVNDPANPWHVGGLTSSGSSSALAIAKGHAWVADGEGGLKVIDISDPTEPIEVGALPMPGEAFEVAVSGDLAYVLSPGLQIIDIRDPANPQLIHAVAGRWRTLAALGSIVYAVSSESGFHMFDMSAPSNPTSTVIDDTIRDTQSLVLTESNAYLAGDNTGLQILDMDDPAQPHRLGGYFTDRSMLDMAVVGHHAFIADGGTGLLVLDLDHAANPQTVGEHDTPGWSSSVAVSSNRVVLADGDEGLRMIDVGIPHSPVSLSVFDPPEYAQDVAVTGSFAYVADSSGELHIVDLEDPSNPRRVGTYHATNSIEAVTVADGHAYLAVSAKGLEVIDLSDPAMPQLVGHWSVWGAMDVAVSGNFAFLGIGISGWHSPDSGMVQVIDISNPSNPLPVGHVDTLGPIPSLTTLGDYAYVGIDRDSYYYARTGSDLKTLDISVPFVSFEPIISQEAVLRVVPDVTPPILISAMPSSSLDLVSILFNESVNLASALDWFVYLISDGTHYFPVTFVEHDPAGPQDRGFLLHTVPLDPDTHYTLRAFAIDDGRGNLVGPEGTSIAFCTFEAPCLSPAQEGGVPSPAPETINLVGPEDLTVEESNLGAFLTSTEVNVPGTVEISYQWEEFVNEVWITRENDNRPDYHVGPVTTDDDGRRFRVRVKAMHHPTEVSALEVRGRIQDVSVSGHYAYLAAEEAGLHIIDVRDPTHIQRVGGNTSFNAYGVFATEDHVYVAAGNEGLQILDVFIPPVRLDILQPEPGQAISMTVDGPSGATIRLQRSSDLRAWKDWITRTLGDQPLELSDTETAEASHQFYRAVLE